MRKTASGIIVPGQKQPRFVCRLCHATFHDGERVVYERHVVKCSNDQEDRIHDMSLRTRLAGLYGDGVNRPVAGDPEYEQFVRRTGKT